MLPDTLDFNYRAQLSELMDEPCSREQLRACLRDLARVNSLLLGYRPVLHWLDSLMPSLKALGQPIRILDVGCGYGDSLRKIARWAKGHRIAVELTGLDLNPDATAIAAEASPTDSAIEWVNADVFEYRPPRPVHLIVSSLFTHHLTDGQILRFLSWMEANASCGWFINDLSRAPIPYHLFRAFSKVMRFHRFVQHDGPISVARSFRPEEWRQMCARAGLSDRDFAIQTFKPARLCVARQKLNAGSVQQ